MEVKEVTRREIEAKLASIGDYVKMDYLQSCLKKSLDFDTRKFVLVKLSAIYEARRMYLEAAKLIRASADINTTFEGKVNEFVKSAELYIKGGNFDESDISTAKALVSANEKQKVGVRMKIREAYKAYAKDMLSKDKRKHAMEAYEKLLSKDLDVMERKEVQQQLLQLYNKLGKVKEYYALQKSISAPAPAPEVVQKPAVKERTGLIDVDDMFK